MDKLGMMDQLFRLPLSHQLLRPSSGRTRKIRDSRAKGLGATAGKVGPAGPSADLPA